MQARVIAVADRLIPASNSHAGGRSPRRQSHQKVGAAHPSRWNRDVKCLDLLRTAVDLRVTKQVLAPRLVAVRVSIDPRGGVAVLEIAKSYVPPLRSRQITRGVVAHIDASGRCITVEIGDERRRRPAKPRAPEVVLLTGTDARTVLRLLEQISIIPAPTPSVVRLVPRKGRGVDVDPAKLREARLAAGLSMAALAGAELTRSSIHQYETGRARPSRRALEWIAERTGRPIEAFVNSPEASRETADEPAT